MLILGAVLNANAATPSPRRGGVNNVADNIASATQSARSATRAVSRGSAQPSARATVTARSATNQPQQTVRARAAVTTQKVVNSGTKVATAVKNTAVSEECQNKYFGCMDAFCMLDNTSGGRCLCSNRNAELDDILAEIEKLDQQSYQMATYGVEKIEMGADADAAISRAKAVAEESANNVEKSRKKTLDLSLWDSSISLDEEDVFDIFAASSSIDGKTGDALQRAATDLCVAQIPECAADMSMLKLLYAQKIKSDCNAYENSLKQQKNASQTKLATAERALRDAALEQLRAANRYDLGQCTIEFKKCMQTTGGCGDNFASCASIAAMDNTNVVKSTSRKAKNYAIKGSATTIEITASTYDTLLAKKPLCESITKQCQSVADQVWPTFLKDVAPALKSAELIAEDDARQNCIGNISSCFQKACRDNIDPNDPDGSYDMCLTRPETMLNVCKIPLNACGIDASSAAKAQESQIWDFVVARLASMRVDSCTREVKSCLQSEDRCGSDYTQCIGLDTDTIMRMCPYEKLVGCQMVYGENEIRGDAVYEEISTMVQGVMLNIDNNMLTMCQRAADAAMVKVCGDTANCNGLAVDNGAGTRSFKYEVCQYTNISGEDITWGAVCMDSIDGVSEYDLINPGNGAKGWAGKLSGTMYWGDIAYTCKESDTDGVADCAFTTEEEYIAKLQNAGYKIDSEERTIIKERVYGMEMRALTNAVNTAISAIESDPTVQYCMTGRRVQGMKFGDDDRSFGAQGRGQGRFPNLTSQMRQTIALSALKTARENYNKKYDTEIARMMKDQVTMATRVDKNHAIELAQNTCKDWAENSVLPKSEAPKVNNTGKWIAVGLLAAAAVVATVFTFGVGGVAAALGTSLALGGTTVTVSGTAITATTALALGATAAGVASSASAPVGQESETQTTGSATIDQWNYKENVTTTFAPSTGVCTRVRIYQNCTKTKKNYCKEWEEPKEVRDEVTLL
jgi:hypothetical protein